MNPIQLLQMMKQGDPRRVVLSMLNGVQRSNPMISNVIDMINKNDVQGIEQFARNLAKEKGIDADKAIEELMRQVR